MQTDWMCEWAKERGERTRSKVLADRDGKSFPIPLWRGGVGPGGNQVLTEMAELGGLRISVGSSGP